MTRSIAVPDDRARTAGLAVAALVLAVSGSGCAQDRAQRVADAPAAAPAAMPDPAEFCDLANRALPARWTLDEVKVDPYDTGVGAPTRTCILSTGHGGPEAATTVAATWDPDESAADAVESLARMCQRVELITTGQGRLDTDAERCQGVDDHKPPAWTLLAYSDQGEPGVVFVRVDTSDAQHGRTLAHDARYYAAALLAGISS